MEQAPRYKEHMLPNLNPIYSREYKCDFVEPKLENITNPGDAEGTYFDLRTVDATQIWKVKHLNSVSVNPQFDAYKRVGDKISSENKRSCSHEWRPYVGLTQSYEYCTLCDEKKT